MQLIPANLPNLTGGRPEALGLLRRLENGAVLTGRVLRPTTSGTTPIRFGSAILHLVVSQPLDPGVLVKVRMEGAKLLLQIVPEETPGTGRPTVSSSGPSSAGSAGLGTLVAENPVLARVLQLQNLPVQLETLQVLQSVLGNVPADQGPVLAFLLARNIPITPENLNWIRERLRVRENLGKELSSLVREVRAFLQQGAVRGAEHLSTLLVRLESLLTWNQAGSLEERIDQLKEFFSTLEEKLLGGRTDSVARDFKSLLMRLDRLLSTAELGGEHPLRKSVAKVLQLVEGAQLTGLTQTPVPDRNAWVFWRIPFPGDPEPTTVELAVRGDRDTDHPERYSMENLEILVQVDLSNLGPLRIQLVSRAPALKVVFSVTDTRVHDLLQEDFPELQRSLETAGFSEIEHDVRVEAISEGFLADLIDPLKEFEREMDEPSPPQLDIRL